MYYLGYRELVVTDYGTIIGDYFNEILVDDFFKRLERNIESDLYNVFYDKKINSFIITLDGKDYILKLDKKIMEEYVLGNYTEITKKLDSLMKKEMSIRNKDEQLEQEKQEKEEMIELAKSGIIPNDKVRKVYIDYLKKSMKPSIKNLGEYFTNIKEDFESIGQNFMMVGVLYDIIYYNISDDYWSKLFKTFLLNLAAYIILGIGASIFPALAKIFSVLFLLMLWGAFSYFILPYILFISSCLIGYSISRIKRLIKNIKNKKMIKQKIKNLSGKKKMNEKQIKSTTLKQLDELEKKDIEIENIPSKLVVLNEINQLAERLDYINIVDRKRLGKKLRELLNEFITRFDELEKMSNNNSSMLQVSNEQTNLKIEMLSKISDVERELLEIRKRDLEKEQNKQSVQIIEQKIESAVVPSYTEGYTDDLTNGGRAYAKRK